MSSFLFDPLMGGLQSVLDLRLQQHSLTASNLANADTPGYKAKYINFENLLERVIEGNQPLLRTDSRHVVASGYNAEDPEVTELEASPWSIDGNSVLPERETARLASNSLMFGAVSKGMSRRLALLRYAASDGRA